jgi:hypothetical protein
MKKIYAIIILLFSLSALGQKECEYSTNVKDSLGTYKSTKDYVVYERVFGNSQTSIYFSLVNADGLPSLNVQILQKSPDFISAKCFDKNSRIYFQLDNGKIITVLGLEQETCGTTLRNENINNRILNGYFLFMKDTFENLKQSPISIIRIKYAGETVDYVAKSELNSEIDKKTYNPNRFFMDYLKCVE